MMESEKGDRGGYGSFTVARHFKYFLGSLGDATLFPCGTRTDRNVKQPHIHTPRIDVDPIKGEQSLLNPHIRLS